MKSKSRFRPGLSLARICILALAASAFFAVSLVRVVHAQSTVTLSPTAAPSVGQPGVTVISVIGSGFPSGTIPAANVTVSLQPITSGSGVSATATPTAVTTIIGTERRVTFQIPTSISVTSPTSYRVSISGSTSTGVTLASGNSAALTINPPAQISSLSQSAGQPGQTLTVTITTLYTNFLQGATVASLRPGISVGGAAEGALGPVTVISTTSATAQITIDPSTATGPRTVSVATGVQQASLSNGFTVTSPQPALTSVNPNSGQQGQQNLSVSITGQFTHFLQGASQANFGGGITVVSLTVNSPTSATAILDIDPAAATGSRTVALTTGNEGAALANGFTVTPSTPISVSVSPNSGQQGKQNLQVAITGQLSHFVQSATTASFGTGISVVSLTVNSATSATAILDIGPTAAPGLRTVAVATGGEVGALANGFTVTPGTPTLVSVAPNSGQQAQQALPVTLVGQFTNWVQGTTTANFGPGITVASLTVNSSTSATALISIDAAATTGLRTVTMTTGSEVEALNNGFTVTASAPTLVLVSPNTAHQGQQNLAVSIVGQFTHFVQGTSQANFGAGITVTSLTVNSPTTAAAILSVDSSAVPGPRTVTMTTGSEVAGLNNGFTVTSPSAAITVTPNPVAFGNVAISKSSTRTVTISSSGTSPLTLSSITLSGSLFSLQNLPSLPLTLDPNAPATFSVTYAPQGTIISSGTVTVLSNAASSPTLVSLSGTGTQAQQPAAAAITVKTDQPVYRRAQPVQISGALTDGSGAGISNVPVAIQISAHGSTRVLNPYTDAQGNFQAVFQPTPAEGGTYSVTATATSSGATQTASTSFRIFGLLVSPGSLSQDLAVGTTISMPLNLQNIGDASLSNVSYSATVIPTGAVTAGFPQPIPSLAPGAPVTVPMGLTAPAGDPPPNSVSVKVTVSATDSVSGAVDPEAVTFIVTLRPAISTLTLNPPSLSVGVNPGGSLTRRFQVLNTGYAPANNATVTLQDPVTFNWVTLGNANLGDLAPGASQIFQVLINPPANLPLGNYTVLFNVSGGTNPLQGTINISVTQSALGAVAFTVNDDTGSKVAGATITFYNPTTSKTYQGVTGSNGQETISGVDAGDYTYTVQAPSHDPATGSVSVTANATAQVNVLLTYDVVSLNFTVTPTTIQDQYTVVLNITYAINLPKPALKVIPPSFNFSFFPADVPNGQYQCSLSITNTSQTAEVRNVTADASQIDATQPSGQRVHVFFANGTTVYQVGTLAAQASTTVACYATVDGNNVSTHAAGNIVVSGNYDFSLDGNLQQGTTTTNVPVGYTRPTDLFYKPIPFVYDETDPSNPVLEYEGGSYVYTVRSERPENFNALNPSAAPFNGDNLVAFTATQGATDNLDLINANQGNAFWHANFSKSSLVSQGDSTTYDISTLDNGFTLVQAIEAQIAANPVQAFTNPMYVGFEGQWADRTSPDGYLVPVSIITLTPVSAGSPGPLKGAGPLQCLDPEELGCQDPNFNPPDVTIDGQITIQIEQKIRLERQAFNATLGIDATSVLNNTVASIKILDANGKDASSNFFVLVTSDPLGATHGGTVSGQTSVGWQLIPNAGAGGTSPQGTQYQVLATLSYSVNGTPKTTTTQAVTITVLPSPKLQVAYTAPFVVVDAKDAKIRVTVTNTGYGPANNLTIQSMQPTVVNPVPVQSGVPNLFVGFTITGSSNTADSSGYIPGNLTVNFGNVAPGATVSGYWTLHVSQRGFFVGISSTFTHDDYQGVQLDPLVLPPTTTLVPAIGGTVTSNTGQPIPGLTVSLSQNGTVAATDQTGATGEYYMQDLAAGTYVEQIADASGKVWVSQNVAVLAGQPTNFVDVVIQNFAPQKTAATVTLNAASLSQTYTGLPASVTATTVPAGLNVIVTYNGSFIPPVSAGTYNVVATVADPTYQGTATGTLIINKATPIIAWPQPAPIAYGTALSGTQLDASVAISAPSTSSSAAATMLAAPTRASPMTIAQAEITRSATPISGSKLQASAAPNDPPLPASLAFTSDRTGRNQIYTAQNSPLASPTPVTTAGAVQQESEEPDWSRVKVSFFGASGTKIAYQFGAPGVRGIHVINPDGSGDLQLTPAQSASYPCADDRDPTWSPDGQYIAYACQAFSVGSAVPTGTYQIWWHNNGLPANTPTSESFVASYPNTQAYAPAWSPDGNSIVFAAAGPGAKAEIARANVSSGPSGPVTILTTGGYTNFDPTWSPDSTQIAFSSTRAVATDVLTSDGTNPSNGDNIYINGQLYTFVAALSGLPYQVLIGTSAQSTLANLKVAINGENGAGATYGAGTSPNTDLFASFVTSNTLVVQAFQPGVDTEIATHSSSAHLTWASAFLTVAAGGHHIFVMSVACPKAQSGCRPASELTFGAADDTVPAWSPDGSIIAFVSNRVTSQNPLGKSQLYLIGSSQPETASNPPTLISEGTADDGQPAWNSHCSTAQSGLALQISPLSVSSGLATPSPGMVTVTDACGNPVSGATVNITPPQTLTNGSDTVTVAFSPLTGQAGSNGQFTFSTSEPNTLQNSYQLQYTVTASANLNGNAVSATSTGTVDVLGLGPIVPPQPPQGLSNQQRLPIGASPFTAQQKSSYWQLAQEESREALVELMEAYTISLALAGSEVPLAFAALVNPELAPINLYLGLLIYNYDRTMMFGAWAHYIYAKRLVTQAQDPPDPNFTSVALPTVQAPPQIALTGGPLSSNTSQLMSQSLSVSAVIQAYLQALQTSANRYSTALTAGDLTSAALQRDAILNYEDTLVSLFNSDARVTQNLLASLKEDGLPDLQLTAQDISPIQNGIATYGLTGVMIQNLQQLGASATDIATIQNSLISANPESVATDFYSLLQSEAQTSLNASAAFVVGAAPPPGTTNTLQGSFVYTPPAGTLLNAGTQTLSVVFTPVDFTDYTIATATVPLQVSGLPVAITFDPASLTQVYDGSPKSVSVTTNPANLPVTITYMQNGATVAAPTNVGSYAVTATVNSGNYAGTATATLTITSSGTAKCTAPPSGLVSWWAGEGNTSDSLGANNPSASNAVSFVTGEFGTGFTFGPGGYLDIPASPSLANQKFTWSAWVEPNGSGPNNDFLGNWIVGQDIDDTDASVLLSWRSSDNRFSLIFGNISSEQIVSQDTFAPGQFYFVTGTYDGSVFTLYVNGQVEGSFSEVKTVPYSSIPWTIGSSSSNIISAGDPRTWNGVIDEVQAFNRALSQSEIQTIYAAASAGECRGQPSLSAIVPNSGQQGQQNLSVSLTGQFTSWVQGTTIAKFGLGITVSSLTVNAATGATAVLNIDPAAPTGPGPVTLTTGNEVDTLANGFTVAVATTGTPALVSVAPNTGQQGQQNLSVALAGQFTNWVQGTTTASFGAGVTVVSLTVNSPTSATAILNIDPAAATGARTVTMTTGSEVDTLTSGFTVMAPQSVPDLTITKTHTGNFTQGQIGTTYTIVVTNSGTGPTSGPVVVTDTLPAVFTATAISGTGWSCILGTLACTRSDALAAGASYPPITVIVNVASNASSSIPITNAGFEADVLNCQAGPACYDFNNLPGWSGGSTVKPSTEPGGEFPNGIPDGVNVAAIGCCGQPSPNATQDLGFAPTPNTTYSLSVSVGQRSDYPLTGYNVELLVGNASVASTTSPIPAPGSFIVDTLTYNSGPSPGSGHLVIHLGSVGSGQVSFDKITLVATTSGGSNPPASVTNTATVSGGGELNATNDTASDVTTITSMTTQVSVNPNTGQQGQQNLSVTLTGQFTNWAQGTTTASFGAGITVASLTVSSPTSATAILNIDPAAATGVRTVTLTTGTEVESLANGFEVTSGSTVTEVDSVTFSVLNTASPSGTGTITVEADSMVFSVLNTASSAGTGTGANPVEADSVMFSLLNTASPGGAGVITNEADSVIFSVENMAAGAVTQAETKSKTVTARPTAGPSTTKPIYTYINPVDSDGDGYPDYLENALGSDPNDPNSVPNLNSQGEVESVVFSVSNWATLRLPPVSKNDPKKGASHEVKIASAHNPNLVSRVLRYLASAAYRRRPAATAALR